MLVESDQAESRRANDIMLKKGATHSKEEGKEKRRDGKEGGPRRGRGTYLS